MPNRFRRTRTVIAWILLIGSLIGWPLSAFTWAKNEPPFILGLSWLAVVLTAADLLSTSQVHEEQGDGDKGPQPEPDDPQPEDDEPDDEVDGDAQATVDTPAKFRVTISTAAHTIDLEGSADPDEMTTRALALWRLTRDPKLDTATSVGFGQFERAADYEPEQLRRH